MKVLILTMMGVIGGWKSHFAIKTVNLACTVVVCKHVNLYTYSKKKF